ncbi:MAG: Cof-type HAD-IIB family hydrolase [Clostridiales bacterium]|nr:Cof-type HAD-IIB family hydrolase [Clostridiales bacterium]
MSHPTIRLAALDMDGTLLRKDSSISPYTISVIRRLIEKGITVVPASGRNFEVLPEELLALPGIHYGVCANGANVLKLPGGTHLYDFPVSLEDARTIITFVSQGPLFLYIFSNRGIWHSKNWTEAGMDQRYPGFTFQPSLPEDLETFLRHDDLMIDKIGIFLPNETAYRNIEQAGSPAASVTMARTGWLSLEFNSVHASKGNGVRMLCERLGIPVSQVIAIGDNQNDIPMLRMAGVSVAMGNAEDDVKAEADFTARTNEEDGAALFLEEYFDL